MSGDVPSIDEFDPTIIPYQDDVIDDIKYKYDYSKGCHQVLLSGSVGSAKSLLAAHLATRHCIENPGAFLGIGRLTMPDLKETLYQMIIDHIGETVDIQTNDTKGKITFPNGSQILCFSWHDKKYKKFRSYPLSAFVIEELTENDDKQFYDAILMRIGRSKRIKEKFIISCTNPDDPEHWAYKHFIDSKDPKVHVYYSKTKDNPFLDESYYTTLAENLDKKMAMRMLEGLWVSIETDVIYYNYDPEKNFRDWSYEIDFNYPIHISWDFNIGRGKPMSAVMAQYINGAFHWFNQSVVHGARTEDSLDDIASRGLFDFDAKYIINGDATGRHNDTRSKKSDYDIIEKYLSNYTKKIDFEIDVPRRNPPLRRRHNLMNGLFCNVKGQTRSYIYKDCQALHEGCRLTKLAKGGSYVEDDSKWYQHITTAAGYCADRAIYLEESKQNYQREIEL